MTRGQCESVRPKSIRSNEFGSIHSAMFASSINFHANEWEGGAANTSSNQRMACGETGQVITP